MAKQYGKNSAVDFAAANLMSFGKSFSRLNGQPLDKSEVWYKKADLEAYALTDAAFVGQKVTFVDVDNNKVYHYSVELDGTLKEIGTSPIGDNKSIVVAEDGTVSLKGVTTLVFERDILGEDGQPTGQKETVQYQPLMTKDGLVWVEPSKTTVEGLAVEIDTIKGRLDTIEGNIGEVTEGKTVVEMIADAQAAATYDDTALAGRVKSIEDDYLKKADKSEIEGKINTAKSEAITEAVTAVLGEGVDEDFDTLKEIADWILSDTTGAASLVTRISTIEGDYLKGADKTELQDQISELDVLIGDLPEGAVSSNVVAYIQEVVDALKIGDYAKASDLTALAGRVSTLVTNLENLAETVAGKADASTVTALADIVGKAAEGETPASGIFAALDTKVEKVEGSRLITAKEAEKLEHLVLGEDGSVEISGNVNASNVQELYDKVVDIVTGTGQGTYDEVLRDKLGIEKGAQVNVIESIDIDGEVLEVNGKNVSIPKATDEKLGVVKSSADDDKVSVAEDGTMEVNGLNINKLVQSEGDVLVLDGGSIKE